MFFKFDLSLNPSPRGEGFAECDKGTNPVD